jgi:hypothetical protein
MLDWIQFVQFLLHGMQAPWSKYDLLLQEVHKKEQLHWLHNEGQTHVRFFTSYDPKHEVQVVEVELQVRHGNSHWKHLPFTR